MRQPTRGSGVWRDEGLYRALEAGMPAELVYALAAVRRHWLESNSSGVPMVDDLDDLGSQRFWGLVDQALTHPQAPAYDEVMVMSLRRQRGLR